MNIRSRLGAGVALLGVYAGQVHAAVPTAVTDAIDAASADGVTLTGLIAAGLAAFVLLAKAFGKFGLR